MTTNKPGTVNQVGGWDSDAYAKMRDEIQWWKERAERAEELTERLREDLSPTHMGEPVLTAHFADASKMVDLHEKIQEIVTCVYDREYQIDDAARDIVDLIPNEHRSSHPATDVSGLVEALEMMLQMVELGGFGKDAAMDTGRAALAAYRNQGGES